MLRADAGFEVSIGFSKKEIKPESDDCPSSKFKMRRLFT
jgi:hypothetical protein